MISRAGCVSEWRWLGLLSLVVLDARAEGEAQQALAEALFAEGKRLMVAERYGEACPKLAESQRLDPAGGTVLLLALCLERQGRLASAWATFSTALAVAQRERAAEREAIAQQHIAALLPRLPRLRVDVSPALAAAPGLEVRLDGARLAEASWGVAAPVDAGEHEIEALAPGQPPLRQRVQITDEGKTVSVLLSPRCPCPPGAECSSACPPAPPPDPSASQAAPAPSAAPIDTGRPRRPEAPRARWPGYAAAGLGAAALLAGAAAAWRASSLLDEANRRCPQRSCSDAEAIRLNDRAGTLADVATITISLGALSAGLGAWWLLKAPVSPAASRARGQVGLQIQGIF